MIITNKIHLQAWRINSIFKYMKLKSYDKKNLFIPKNTLKMNKRHRVHFFEKMATDFFFVFIDFCFCL